MVVHRRDTGYLGKCLVHMLRFMLNYVVLQLIWSFVGPAQLHRRRSDVRHLNILRRAGKSCGDIITALPLKREIPMVMKIQANDINLYKYLIWSRNAELFQSSEAINNSVKFSRYLTAFRKKMLVINSSGVIACDNGNIFLRGFIFTYLS